MKTTEYPSSILVSDIKSEGPETIVDVEYCDNQIKYFFYDYDKARQSEKKLIRFLVQDWNGEVVFSRYSCHWHGFHDFLNKLALLPKSI